MSKARMDAKTKARMSAKPNDRIDAKTKDRKDEKTKDRKDEKKRGRREGETRGRRGKVGERTVNQLSNQYYLHRNSNALVHLCEKESRESISLGAQQCWNIV